jgi:hypothetical protein
MRCTLRYAAHEVKDAEGLYFTIGEQLQANNQNFTIKQGGDYSEYEITFTVPDEKWDDITLAS